MNHSTTHVPQTPAFLFRQLAVSLASVLLLAACGAGGPGTTPQEPAAVQGCDPGNAASTDQCGTLLLGITDADGDFLSYSVNVVSLQLEMANGRVVETLPATTRMDFARYVDLTEILTAASVPPGTYVAGTLVLDYSDAEVIVEHEGAGKDAMVVDSDGNTITDLEMTIQLAGRDRLVVTQGRASVLTVDFDLAASHDVDFLPTPAIATAAPFIVAEINPVVSKDIRVRGPLVSVSGDDVTYTVAIRPFHERSGDFGRVPVNVKDSTRFEVNDTFYSGLEGLRALDASGTGTPTIAQGTLNLAERTFTADVVLAGSSVPGIESDAVRGNVIARRGNELVVRGGTIIPEDGRASFRDDVVVIVGPDTNVYRRGTNERLDIDAISVGQAITIRGDVVSDDGDTITLDATRGAARLHFTHLSGIARTVYPGQIDIDLRAIDRRPVAIFDFVGTGVSRDQDADPDNYEVATGTLPMSLQGAGKPVAVTGFPNAFGMAPPDFEGRTLIDFTDVRSMLGVGWGVAGTTVPFLSIGTDGLVLDNSNSDIDSRHYVKQGPVLIDLTALDSGTQVMPRPNGRALYVLKRRDRVQLYTDFDDFVADLTTALDGATAARSMYARGLYATDTNVFTAYMIGVHLLD